MSVLVVGNVSEFDKSLSSLGTDDQVGYYDSATAAGADAGTGVSIRRRTQRTK